MTIVNLVSPRFVGQVDGPLLVIATAGWFWFAPAQFTASWNVAEKSDLAVLPHTLVLVFWAFTGLESASVASAVVENPEQTSPSPPSRA